jgi:hypothetical protein
MSATTVPSEVPLRTIADWQLAPEKCEFLVELPKLQRGFVWEPAKVMDLWDSILRGFPIGSMMVSAIDPEPTLNGPTRPDRYWLLDGQQRATSIAIGFYHPWKPERHDPSMWSLKNISIPILWVDLLGEPRCNDQKMFFPNLVTQSHPWGYESDGGVISWGERRAASTDFKLPTDYTKADLKSCFPWMAKFPVPLPFLIDIAQPTSKNASDAWTTLVSECRELLPEPWQKYYEKYLDEPAPPAFFRIIERLSKLEGYKIHLNYLTSKEADNDTYNADGNSLLFVRLNTGGVVLGGEELIFSLFKSAFGHAKDAVEKCATGFMAPSKLFGLLVRLAAAESNSEKLARPVSLAEFKKEIREPESSLKKAMENLIKEKAVHTAGEAACCEAACLMASAKLILCGDGTAETEFCLPEAVATRTINESPDVFLALLHWLRKGGNVKLGSEQHQEMLGQFTALSWFLPGNARAKQEALREWIAAAGDDIEGRLWSGESLSFLFTREDLAVPVFPLPEQLRRLIFCDGPDKVRHSEDYNYDSLAGQDHVGFWNQYQFLPDQKETTEDSRSLRLEGNFKAFLAKLWSSRSMLLYAQRNYLRRYFQSFGQWELTLKDTNCPWDWDHIYPSAYYRRNPDRVYKDWHHTIGNLRALALSDNRSDKDDWPGKKLNNPSIRKHSFISEALWRDRIEGLEARGDATQHSSTASVMSVIILTRMVDIYEEWHGQLRIGHLMDEIRNVTHDTLSCEESATSPTSITEPSFLST